jgi:hypothetical protein
LGFRKKYYKTPNQNKPKWNGEIDAVNLPKRLIMITF